MSKYYSLIASFIICIFLVEHRHAHKGFGDSSELKLTNWDAFGYYAYLPAILIYKDYKQLKWQPATEEQYKMTGSGELYQATKAKNGNYVFKYFGGVALMQLPFFLAAHYIAPSLGYPADGFSQPYQYAVAVAALFYAFLGLFVLRRLLKKYYDDAIVAITLLLLCLATNFVQYAAVDAGQSHVYIFPLYATVLYATYKWHKQPAAIWAMLIGYIIGLATICRPTEALMLFIPLLWNTHTKDAAKQKWQTVRNNAVHILLAITGGIAGILPQLLYWKSTAGTWIFDVGSAWDFLTPHVRVLTGWEKGWFIYTPVTILFIAGMFFIRKHPFRKSVTWFCILNIYLIISWRDWQYGGSYSTRALVQSYPVFALPLAAFMQHIQLKKYRWVMYVAGAWLIAVNIFQLEQYAKTILHYRDMNRRYYGAIYLDKNPTPIDMSLLDHNEVLRNEAGYEKTDLLNIANEQSLSFNAGEHGVLLDTQLHITDSKEAWIKVISTVNAYDGFWQGYINCELRKGDSVKHTKIRLFNPISKARQDNEYTFYTTVPTYFNNAELKVYLSRSEGHFDGIVNNTAVTLLHK